MAQLFITGLDDGVAQRLQARARRSGRKLEAEACTILTEAVAADPRAQGLEEEVVPGGLQAGEKGLGDLMYERFKDIGLTEDEFRRFSDGIAEANSLWEMGLPDFEQDEYEEDRSE